MLEKTLESSLTRQTSISSIKKKTKTKTLIFCNMSVNSDNHWIENVSQYNAIIKIIGNEKII